jgi:hypothetical protein
MTHRGIIGKAACSLFGLPSAAVVIRPDAVAAFGAEDWSSGVPFTALIDTDGKILYKTQGGMNALEVRRALLKNLPDDRYVGQHAYWNSSF